MENNSLIMFAAPQKSLHPNFCNLKSYYSELAKKRKPEAERQKPKPLLMSSHFISKRGNGLNTACVSPACPPSSFPLTQKFNNIMAERKQPASKHLADNSSLAWLKKSQKQISGFACMVISQLKVSEMQIRRHKDVHEIWAVTPRISVRLVLHEE